MVELGCLMVADLGVMGAQGYLQSTIVGDPTPDGKASRGGSATAQVREGRSST